MNNGIFFQSKNVFLSRKGLQLLFSAVRYRRSRWLGYYERKIPAPVYEERKRLYREKVLQALEVMPSLDKRLKDMNIKDPVLDARVDIGFPSARENRGLTTKQRIELWKKIRQNQELETLAREKQIKVDLEQVREEWQQTDGKVQLRNIADHYGIFTSLFDHGYFMPCVPLNIFYDYDENSTTPIYMGNILEADEAKTLPHVHFKSQPDDLWTLVLTNLDGHLLDTESEYLQWFIGNIKGSDISSGETVCNYLQPFPYRGTGYHRLVFVLYKQTKKLDFSKLLRPNPCVSLTERTFKTFDFYKEHQDFITPAGLSFFQCTWDPSLTNFFHNVLNMREPVFEYKQPDLYCPKQVQFPHKQPFNVYLDRYRDPKEITKEVIVKRLNSIHPFKEEPPMPKYPNLHLPDKPIFSWQKDDYVRERLRIGKFRDLRPHSVYPQEDSRGNHRYKN